MVRPTKENGAKSLTNEMEKDISNGVMEAFMRATGRTTKPMVVVALSMQMETSTTVSG